MDLGTGSASASLRDCGIQEGGDQDCLAYLQIPRPCMVPGTLKCSINICGLITGCGWTAEGSGEMKTGFSALPWNAVGLKGPQNEGVGPGGFGFNTDVWGRWELRHSLPGLHPNVQRDGAPSSVQDPGHRTDLAGSGKGAAWAGRTSVHVCIQPSIQR